jgi:hypothetical protein
MYTIVPPEYDQYLKISKMSIPIDCPAYCYSNHQIALIYGFKPPFGPLYSLSRPGLEELKYWLNENKCKGFIHTSSSLATAPILFIKKGDHSWILVINYRGINEGTIKNRYPPPL